MRAAWTLFTNIHRLVLSMLLLTGCPFVLIGSTEAWQVWHQLHSYPTVTGRVVDNDYRATDDGGGAYYPIVAFTPVDGPSVRFTDRIGSLPADYAPGTSIEVVYNPAHVQEARIRSWKRLWFVPILLISVGSLPSVLYLGWRAYSRRRAPAFTN
jgi:Protein of unknown function (DUF3592)